MLCRQWSETHMSFLLRTKLLFMNSSRTQPGDKTVLTYVCKPLYMYTHLFVYKKNKKILITSFIVPLFYFALVFNFLLSCLIWFPFCSNYLFNFVKSSNFIFSTRIKTIGFFYLLKFLSRQMNLSLRYSHLSFFIFYF